MSINAITWTAEQLAVFAHFANSAARHLVVRARAGTGKTTVILHAVSKALWANSILLCAFNKRIAEELKTKCLDPRCEIKTLHAIGFSFLRPLGKLRVDGNREMLLARKVCGRHADELVPVVAKLATKIKEINHEASLQDAIDLAWRFDCLPETSSIYADRDIAQYALEVCRASQERDGTISFADMLYLPLALNLVRPQWDLVVVDEAQDMSPSQILLAQLCCKPEGRIVVVGDDRQGIYGFRGADSNTIDHLKSELQAEELGLTVTHRCPRLVVEYAKTLVPDYTASDLAPEGEIRSISYNALFDTAEPGAFVLSRKNAPLMATCLGFLKRGVRAKIQGRDVGAQLSNLIKKLKASSIQDLLSKLETWRQKEIARAQARGNGIGGTREDQVNDIADTVCALCEDVADMQELESRVKSLFDEVDSQSGVVVCSSVHKAKGLEASEVFILASTLYPGNGRAKWIGESEDSARYLEERNIEYVAVTRSKSVLTWVVE